MVWLIASFFKKRKKQDVPLEANKRASGRTGILVIFWKQARVIRGGKIERALEVKNRAFHQCTICAAHFRMDSGFAGTTFHQQPANDGDRNQNNAVFHRWNIVPSFTQVIDIKGGILLPGISNCLNHRLPSSTWYQQETRCPRCRNLFFLPN